MHNGNTRPPALCAGEAPDEKLKINELGPNENFTLNPSDAINFKITPQDAINALLWECTINKWNSPCCSHFS